jgi:drug/metabolite transporter (DMT)-like permease
MGILLGLVAAFGWGAGDFCARYATHRLGAYLTVFFAQFVGMFVLSLYLLFTGQLQFILSHTSWTPWAWALLAASLNATSSLALYRAFEVGTLMIVSPIAASYAVVTVALAFFSGEVLTYTHDIALGLVFIGIIGAATPFVRVEKNIEGRLVQSGQGEGRQVQVEQVQVKVWGRHRSFQGIVFAVIASFGYGCNFWLLGFHVTPFLGSIIPVWITRLLTPCILLACAPLFRQSFTLPRRDIFWLLAVVSILDTIAFVAYTLGTGQGQISIVTMLSSLYSAITVVLAWFFLRERLQWSQWLSIGVIFAGIVLVNV